MFAQCLAIFLCKSCGWGIAIDYCFGFSGNMNQLCFCPKTKNKTKQNTCSKKPSAQPASPAVKDLAGVVVSLHGRQWLEDSLLSVCLLAKVS